MIPPFGPMTRLTHSPEMLEQLPSAAGLPPLQPIANIAMHTQGANRRNIRPNSCVDTRPSHKAPNLGAGGDCMATLQTSRWSFVGVRRSWTGKADGSVDNRSSARGLERFGPRGVKAEGARSDQRTACKSLDASSTTPTGWSGVAADK